jgi:SLOG in TRPM, prokaryote
VAEAFNIKFENGQQARAARVSEYTGVEDVGALLNLQRAKAALTIHAGAAGASKEDVERILHIFEEQLAPLATKHQLPIFDGGTLSGVVGLMGVARAKTNGTFPLIGVVPFETVSYPGGATGEHLAAIDPNHTHFAMVEGGSWGVESRLLVNLGRSVSLRRVALLINGGEIVRKEALMHARAGNALLVVSGSGRVADEIAEALKIGTSNEMVRETITVGFGRIRACTLDTLMPQLIQMLHLEP